MNEELRLIITAQIDNFKNNVNNAKKSIKDFVKEGTKDFSALNDEFQKYGDFAKKGLAVAAGAMVAAGGAILGLSAATSEYRNEQAKLVTAFEAANGSAAEAEATYNSLYRVLGDSGQATEAAGHLAKLTTEEKALSEWTNICQGIYATFGDSLPIEGLTEAANETAKVGQLTGGLADALNWAGVSEDEFQEKLDACNTEAEREALIRTTLNGLYNDAAAKYEKNNKAVLAQNEAQAKLEKSMAKVGEAVAPINTALTELGAKVLAQLTPYIEEFAANHLPKIVEALSGVGDTIGKIITWIADNWELVSTIATIVAAIAIAIAAVSTALGIYNTVMAITTAVSAPVIVIVAAIVAAIAALVAIIVICVKHWDEIKEAIGKAWEFIKEKTKQAVEAVVNWFNNLKERISYHINNIKDNIVTIFTNIRDTMKAYIEMAKEIVLSIFDGIKSGIQNKIETVKNVISNVVKLIKAIFTGDFGAARDAVIGIFESIYNGIKNKIENAKNTVKNVIDAIKGFFNFTWSLPKLKMPHVSITGKFSLSPLEVPKFSISWYEKGGVFDTATLFGYGNGLLGGLGENGAEAVVPLENNLGWLDKLATMLSDRMGAGTPIILTVDGKVFAQTAIRTINQQTKQTGELGLVLA